jgi:outer membrane protein
MGAALSVGLLSFWAAHGLEATAQQKIGYIDSGYILNQMPEYATVQQKLDQAEAEWRDEIQQQRERVQALRQEFQARELLYTDEERAEKQQAIDDAQAKVNELRERYFGPNGELYTRQQTLMRPIQERVLAATEEVATSEGYDYVFDKSGDFLFLFARDQYDVSNDVLRELGINVEPDEQ